MEIRIATGRPQVARGSVGLRTQLSGESLTVTNVLLASDIVECDIK